MCDYQLKAEDIYIYIYKYRRKWVTIAVTAMNTIGKKTQMERPILE
jgi:hypothetical protein